MNEPAQPAEPIAAPDEMLVNVNFSVRLGEFFADADNDALVAETQRMLVQLTERLMAQHPHAHLHGDVAVSIQLSR